MDISNNYTMKKFKDIFIDGVVAGVKFYLGSQLEYICIVEDSKTSLLQKTKNGGSKVVDIRPLKAAALKFFNNNDNIIITDYTTN